jgi:ketosteroid isomerase-like protein
MIRLERLWPIVAAVVLFGSIPAVAGHKPKSKAEMEATRKEITKVSDSAYAVFEKAVATSDANLLTSFFVDTAGVVMPDQNSITGLGNIRSKVPLLLRIVGGAKMDIKRTSMRVMDTVDLARDAGTFTLTRKLEDGGTWKFYGVHTLFWKKTGDGPWKLDRAFLGEDPRHKGQQ